MQTHAEFDRSHNRITLSIAGELDLATAADVPAALTAFQATNFDHVTLDLADVKFCDCAGLTALIDAHRMLANTGSRPRIVNASQPVLRIIGIAGCQWLLPDSGPHAPPASGAQIPPRPRSRPRSAARSNVGRS